MKKQLLVILTLLIALGIVAQTITAPLGSGTETDPYQISSYENLNWLTSRDEAAEIDYLDRMSANYIQTADIEFPADSSEWDENQGFMPIGWGSLSESFPFSGDYNGQGHIISNLYINRPSMDSVALFGLLITGNIEDLGLVDVDITGSWGIAGLVGEMDTNSLVNNVFVTGDVVGEAIVGGITSYNFESEINNSYFIGSLESGEALGGIAGYNDNATITNSYSIASFENVDYAGFLIGLNDASTVSNSFWNSDLANGLPGIADDTDSEVVNTLGKTTEELTTQATFTDAGWNFTDTWQINAEINNSYPSFTWQGTTTEPEIEAPMNLTATVAGQDVTLNWLAPGTEIPEGITEGFEGTFAPEGWNVESTNTTSSWAQYETVSFTTGDVVPTEGSYQAGVEWDYSAQDEWLVTPEISNVNTLTFDYYGSTGSPEGDNYFVKVSTDGGTNWTPVWNASDLAEGENHYATPVVVDLSAYVSETISIAWNFVDGDGAGLWWSTFIDNIIFSNNGSAVAFNASEIKTFSKAVNNANPTNVRNNRIAKNPNYTNIRSTRDLTAYKIYRDDVEIATLAATVLTYVDAELENGTYDYYVTAMYGDEESEASNTVSATVNVIDSGEYILEDSFETYPDFALEADPWVMVDVDGSTTYSVTDTTWENAEAPMAYIIFNPLMTTPALAEEYYAHTGDKYAVSFASTVPTNDDWLITQEFTPGYGGVFSFYGKSVVDQYGLERFNVLVSYGSTNPNDFTSISGAYYIQAPDEWNRYSYSLNDYANETIRVAIQCVSDDAFMFMVDDVTIIGEGGTDINSNDIAVVSQLKGNYPNPFNPETTIAFSTKENGPVSIDIYNIKGQKVKALVSENMQAGPHTVVWNGRDDNGKDVASGLFFYKMKSGKYTSTKKMILMK